MKPSFSEHLCDLLYRNDCVILPGFGGFLTERKPATIHPVSHRFSPPRKAVMFNPRLQTNDGLLTNELSIAREIPYKQAFDQLMKEVQEIKASLAKGERVDLAPLGYLMQGMENTIHFEEDLDKNLLLDSYGLTEFRSTFIVRAESDEVRETLHKTAERHKATERQLFQEQEEATKKHRWWVAAAAAALLIGFGTWNLAYKDQAKDFYKNYAFLIPFVDVPEAQYTSISPIEEVSSPTALEYPSRADVENALLENTPSNEVEAERPEETQVEPVDPIDPDQFKAVKSSSQTIDIQTAPRFNEDQGKGLKEPVIENQQTELIAQNDAEVKQVADPVKREEKKADLPKKKRSEVSSKPSGVATSAEAKYLIISGCFAEPGNAEKQVRILKAKGYQAPLQFTGSKSNLNYVAFAGFASRAEATEALRKIRATDAKDAWLYVN